MTQAFKPLLPQRGVSIITAIFLLLLFAMLAALMSNVIATAHTTSAEDVLGARAYQAARGGAEWGLYQVLDPENTTAISATAALPACFVPSPAQVSGMGADVWVSCAIAGDYNEGSRQIRIYRIVSTATLAGPGLTIEREVAVTAEKCRDAANTLPPFDC